LDSKSPKEKMAKEGEKGDYDQYSGMEKRDYLEWVGGLGGGGGVGFGCVWWFCWGGGLGWVKERANEGKVFGGPKGYPY